MTYFEKIEEIIEIAMVPAHQRANVRAQLGRLDESEINNRLAKARRRLERIRQGMERAS